MKERDLRESFKFSTRDIALIGILIAAEIVLSRF